MMFLHRLPQRFARDLARIVEQRALNAGDVVMRWNAAAAPADKNVESSYPTPVPMTETVGALIHWVSQRAVERGFTEFKAGDAIVSFEQEVDLDRRDLVFELPDGQTYVQSTVGKAVAQFWDVVIGGEPLTRTLLLRLK